MQVQNININNSKYINFSGWYRVVKNPNTGEMLYRNDTMWFRDGITDIVDSLVKQYKDNKHVDTRIYGCSNGSEPLSMYIYMAAKYGLDIISKFSPFNCIDIDQFAIKKAIAGIMPMEYFEFERVLEYTFGKFNEFFNDSLSILTDKHNKKFFEKTKKFKDGSTEEGICLNLKSEHAQNINYSVGNILEDVKEINPEELSIVCARNFIPYLEEETISKLFSDLNNRMKKGSALILGDYDFSNRDKMWLPDFLKENLRLNKFSIAKGNSGYVFIKK